MTFSQVSLQLTKGVKQRTTFYVGGKLSYSFQRLQTKVRRFQLQNTVVQSSSDEEVYVGYDKQKQQPKYQKGDPSKYPGKEDVGAAMGITGGWAGGEKGLKQFLDQGNGNVEPNDQKSSSKGTNPPPVKVIQQDGDKVYIGNEQFIVDDDRKYPDKESIGFLEGITGGFAGGETGLKNYVEKGEVELEQEQARRQFSPLYIAAIVAVSGVVGGILLTYSTKWAAQTLITELLEAPIDDNSKLLVEVAIVLLAAAGVIGGGRFAFKRMGNINENWAKYATLIAITYGSLFVIVRTLVDM